MNSLDTFYNVLFFLGVIGVGTAIGLGSYLLFVLLERKWSVANLILGNIGLTAWFCLLVALLPAGELALTAWVLLMLLQIGAATVHCRKSRQEWVYPCDFHDSLLIFSGAALTSLLALYGLISLLPAGFGGFVASLYLVRYGSLYDTSLFGAATTAFTALWMGPFVTRVIADLHEFLWELRPE